MCQKCLTVCLTFKVQSHVADRHTMFTFSLIALLLVGKASICFAGNNDQANRPPMP